MNRRTLAVVLGSAAAFSSIGLLFMKDRITSKPPSDLRLDTDSPEGVETVYGVVYPPGADGGRAGKASAWHLRVGLNPWRSPGAKLERTPLSVSKAVSDDELKGLMHDLPAYRIVAMLVRFSSVDRSRADLVAIQASAPSDAELEQEALELQKPITIDDSVFGTLTFNRDVSWWEGTATWQGRSIRFHLDAENRAELTAAIQAARALWLAQPAWNERIRTYAVRELLPLKNSSWLEENETPVTPAVFDRRMTLESITVTHKGGFSFFHDDGGLFWGHAIEITGTLESGPTDADIPG